MVVEEFLGTPVLASAMGMGFLVMGAEDVFGAFVVELRPVESFVSVGRVSNVPLWLGLAVMLEYGDLTVTIELRAVVVLQGLADARVAIATRIALDRYILDEREELVEGFGKMNVWGRLRGLYIRLFKSFTDTFAGKFRRRYAASNFWNLICLAPSRHIVFMYKLWAYQKLMCYKSLLACRKT